MTRLGVFFLATIACILAAGCGHQRMVRPTVAPTPGEAAPWQGPVRVAVTGESAFDAATERDVPRRMISALLSGIGVSANVECLDAASAGGQQAVHATLRVSFAAGTTEAQRQQAVGLLGALAPREEAFGEFLDVEERLAARQLPQNDAADPARPVR